MAGWFWIDAASSVPFDTLVVVATRGWAAAAVASDADTGGKGRATFKISRLPRLLRLLKMMRLLRVMKFMKQYEDVVWFFLYSRYANAFRLLRTVVSLLLLAHYMACVFWLCFSDKWATEPCHYDDGVGPLSSNGGNGGNDEYDCVTVTS